MTAVVTADAGPGVEGRSLLGLGVLGLSPLATPGLGLIIRLQQLQRLRQLQQLQRLQQVQLLLGGGRPALGNNEDRRPAYTPGHSLLLSCFKASFINIVSVSVCPCAKSPTATTSPTPAPSPAVRPAGAAESPGAPGQQRGGAGQRGLSVRPGSPRLLPQHGGPHTVITCLEKT